MKHVCRVRDALQEEPGFDMRYEHDRKAFDRLNRGLHSLGKMAKSQNVKENAAKKGAEAGGKKAGQGQGQGRKEGPEQEEEDNAEHGQGQDQGQGQGQPGIKVLSQSQWERSPPLQTQRQTQNTPAAFGSRYLQGLRGLISSAVRGPGRVVLPGIAGGGC